MGSGMTKDALIKSCIKCGQLRVNCKCVATLESGIESEIERCRELGRIWAEEGTDAEFPASPEDRERFFTGQADRLQALLDEPRA